jgi:hypothetical protein
MKYHRNSEKEHHDKTASSHKKETTKVKATKKKSEDLHEEATGQWHKAKNAHDKHMKEEEKKQADIHEQWRITYAAWENGELPEGSEAPIEPEELVVSEYELAAPEAPLLPSEPEPLEPLNSHEVRKVEDHEEIETPDGTILVLSGRYVLTDSAGNQFSVSEEELDRLFVVEEEK